MLLVAHWGVCVQSLLMVVASIWANCHYYDCRYWRNTSHRYGQKWLPDFRKKYADFDYTAWTIWTSPGIVCWGINAPILLLGTAVAFASAVSAANYVSSLCHPAPIQGVCAPFGREGSREIDTFYDPLFRQFRQAIGVIVHIRYVISGIPGAATRLCLNVIRR